MAYHSELDGGGARTPIKMYSDNVARRFERGGSKAPYEICELASRIESLGSNGEIYLQILEKIYWRNYNKFRNKTLKGQISGTTEKEFMMVLDRLDDIDKKKSAIINEKKEEKHNAKK